MALPKSHRELTLLHRVRFQVIQERRLRHISLRAHRARKRSGDRRVLSGVVLLQNGHGKEARTMLAAIQLLLVVRMVQMGEQAAGRLERVRAILALHGPHAEAEVLVELRVAHASPAHAALGLAHDHVRFVEVQPGVGQ